MKRGWERCVMCDTGRWPYEPWLMVCPYCKGTQMVKKKRKRAKVRRNDFTRSSGNREARQNVLG